MMEDNPGKVLVLFDVDGTLTKSRNAITVEMDQFISELQKKVTVGLVGGSDLRKIAEQMSPNTGDDDEKRIKDLIQKYPYVFPENGLIAYENGQLIGKHSLLSMISETNLQRFINFCLAYLSKIDLPVKRGNFIEFRTGMINVSPIGRSCTQAERDQFFAYDTEHQIRVQMVEAMKSEFDKTDLNLSYAIGGQISIDCFPNGWDKTFCLKYVEHKFDQIYFFGDRTFPGGNDHEIFADARTIGHSVTDPDNTRQLLTDLFF